MAAVEEETGIADTVGRKTRFLEEVGLLEPEGQKHRLTETGDEIARALGAGRDDVARERLRSTLVDWPVTEEVRGVVRENPLPEAELVPVIAAAMEQDPDSARVRSGITTLLELFEWTDLLASDEEGCYRIPEPREAATESGEQESPVGGSEAEAGSGENQGDEAEPQSAEDQGEDVESQLAEDEPKDLEPKSGGEASAGDATAGVGDD